MMRKIKNGEPVFHPHECSDARRGQVMTAEELHDFSVQVLMAEYAETGATVERANKSNPFEPDFHFKSSDKKIVNVLVVYSDEIDGDISDIDTSWLINDFRRNGIIPRITFASAWCEDEKSENGKPAICGGDFCFKYYSVSVMPDQENRELDKKLTPVELAVKYAEAWKQSDASIVEPYLDKDFHYSSDWVFYEMPCRAEYVDYFRGKLETIGNSPNKPEVSIGRNHQTGQVCLLMIQRKNLYMMVLVAEGGRIKAARLQSYSRMFKPFNPKDELYMTHGDHLDALMPARQLVDDHLHSILADSKLWRKTRTRVTTDSMYEEKTDVYSLMYGEKDIRILSTIAFAKEDNKNELVSFYPVCKGRALDVHIDRVIEWDNQLEATVYCSIGEFEFAFFAVDYYCNKHKYEAGKKLTVDVAAMAMTAEEAQRGFSFEGQHAIDWLAKMGGKPSYDERGNVKPVRFNMEKLVAFFNVDSKCPDEAEFQSPVGPVEPTEILGVDFFKTTVTICRRNTDDGELEVSVPLYFRQDFFPAVKEGDPLRGWLWLTGSVTGQHEEGADDADDNHLGEMAADFQDYMNGCSFKTFENLMFVLDKLPLLKIRSGYELDAFRKGDIYGWTLQPYCYREGSNVRYIPSEHGDYDDSMYIQDTITRSEAKSVPDILPYFSVPFTEEGIMQAWMLDNLDHFMPRGWHACYGSRTFIFETEVIERMFGPDGNGDRKKVSEQVWALDLETLLPKVFISENHATLEYAYWNNWRGLVKAKVEVEKDGNTVRFGECAEDVIVAYKSEIVF